MQQNLLSPSTLLLIFLSILSPVLAQTDSEVSEQVIAEIVNQEDFEQNFKIGQYTITGSNKILTLQKWIEPNSGLKIIASHPPQKKWLDSPEIGHEQLFAVLYLQYITQKEVELSLRNLGLEVHSWGAPVFLVKGNAHALKELSKLPWVVQLQNANIPHTTNNYREKTNHRAHQLRLAKNNLQLDGSGIIMGEWDGTGAGPHIDYDDRHTRMEPFSNNNNGKHATHVCGTMSGGGVIDPLAEGMAPGSQIFSWDFSGYIPQEMDSAVRKQNIMITQNSYSYGSSYDVCSRRGSYDIISLYLDQLTFENEHLMHVFAAGNSRSSNCLTGGYGTVHSGYQSAKNSFVVGAVYYNDNNSWFSSYGPIKDGRLKPNVTAVGVDVYSTFPYNNYRGGYNGTSMACPGTSGSAALLYQAYKNLYGQIPPGVIIKNALMNTAKDLGRSGPDYQYGYGRIDVSKSLNLIENKQFTYDSIASQGVILDSFYIATDGEELRVMLAWDDAPAVSVGTHELVRDLDLWVLDASSNNYHPWVLNPSNPTATATRGKDTLNNQEQVTISNAKKGWYYVVISANQFTGIKQKYALSWWNKAKELAITYPNGGEQMLPPYNTATTQVIRWNSFGISGTGTLQFSEDLGQSWKTLSSNVNIGNEHYLWNSENQTLATDQAMVRIIQGTDTGTSNAPFTIGNQVTNLQHIPCKGQLYLTWDVLPHAQKYKVYRLEGGKMKVQGTTDTNFFLLDKLVDDTAHWVAISGIFPHGGETIRSNGIELQTDKNNLPPIITLQPKDIRLCAASTHNFISVAQNGDPKKRFWELSMDNGKTWNSTTSGTDTLSILKVTTQMQGNLYRAVFQNQCGNKVYSDEVALLVDSTLTFSHSPASLDLCHGNDSNFQVAINGEINPVYTKQWMFFEQHSFPVLPLSGQSSLSLPLTNLRKPNSGYYGMQAENSCGIFMDTAKFSHLNVREPIIVDLHDTLICRGGTANFTAKPRGGKPVDYKYFWTALSDKGTGPTFSIQPEEQEFIKLAITDDCSEDTARALVNVLLRDSLKISVNLPDTICHLQSFEAIAAAVGGVPEEYAFQWTDLTTNNDTVSYILNQSQPITVSVADGCSDHIASATKTVFVRKPLSINLSHSGDSICIGQEKLILSNAKGGNPQGYNFNWSNASKDKDIKVAPSTSTWYYLSLADGCSPYTVKDSIKVDVRLPLSLEIQGPDTLCYLEKGNLSALAKGGNPNTYTYSWSTTETTKSIEIVEDRTIDYEVVLKDGCTTPEVKANFKVFRRPKLELNLHNDTLICYGSEVELTAKLFGGNPNTRTYSWENPKLTDQSLIVSPKTATTYTLQAQDFCSDQFIQDAVSVSILPELKLGLTKDFEGCLNETYEIVAEGTGGDNSNTYTFYQDGIVTNPKFSLQLTQDTSILITIDDQCSTPDSQVLNITYLRFPPNPLEVTQIKDKQVSFGLIQTKQGTQYEILAPATALQGASGELSPYQFEYPHYGKAQGCLVRTAGLSCKDTACSTFDIVDVLTNNPGNIIVYPNPFTHNITLAFDEIPGKLKWKITSSTGEQIGTGEQIEYLNKEVKMDLSFLASGHYILEIEANQKKKTLQILKL